MSNTIFTKEQINELKNNKYVRNITEKSITYTDEFKELFVTKYNDGMLPTAIFSESGFDVTVLGRRRILSSCKRFRDCADRLEGFKDTRISNSGRPSTKDKTTEEQLKLAQEKILYLQQENEFLKKIRRVERQAKKKH